MNVKKYIWRYLSDIHWAVHEVASSDSESCEWNIMFAERMNIKHLYQELLLVYYNMHWKSFHSFSSIVQLINEY